MRRERAELQFHGEEVIDDFEIAGSGGLLDLFDFLFHSVDELLDLDLRGDSLWMGQSMPVTLEQ
jgi:hypothetical protein